MISTEPELWSGNILAAPKEVEKKRRPIRPEAAILSLTAKQRERFSRN
jgi:hypothetical protein